MNVENKIIRDPIHGNIKLEGILLKLLETPEIQHLYNIKQLGFAHLVFPGAHHTRLEHSLGVYHLATRVAETLNLRNSEKEIIRYAAFLHDIGHGPFSHTLESILRETFDIDHIGLTEKLIFGEYEIFDSKEKKYISSPSVCQILDKNHINKYEIVQIIKGDVNEKTYLSQILNSAIDIDQLDYLIRDAYYTGVAYGLIDIERFLQTLLIKNNNLCVTKKGISVVENILMARTLMYSSVYFHKTVRIAELMLSKAIELIEDTKPFEFFKMTDAELINHLKAMGSYQHEIATRLKFRKLFKQAYFASSNDLTGDQMDFIKELENPKKRKEKEREIEDKLKIPKGHVIIDIPYQELHLSEPRIDLTNIEIFDENKMKTLDSFTPVAKAIRSRDITDWTIMIITEEKYRKNLSEKVEKIIFN